MKKTLLLLLIFGFGLSCSTDESSVQSTLPNTEQNTDDEGTNTGNDEDNEPDDSGDTSNDNETTNEAYTILSLGDSYTIGESVCSSCRFPEQLKDSLADRYQSSSWNLDVIAQTGWTTTNLINAIAAANLSNEYSLVTLLIGVNNQYQNKPFSLYESEFPELINTSIEAAQGDKNNVIVISIPDYAYTPFGQAQGNPETISTELDAYNVYAETYCEQEDISFVYITDITRQGLENTDLVASDGLHPSTLAYTKFVERLLPLAIEKIGL